jgi:hypothetical protein
MEIGSAPKNGEFIILQDAAGGSWEVGRWSAESHGWVGLDGSAAPIVPTHWQPVAGTVASQSQGATGFLNGVLKPTVFAATRFPLFNLFVRAFVDERHGARLPRGERWRLFSAVFSVAVLLAAVYATSNVRVAELWPIRMLELDQVAMWMEHPRQDDAGALERDLGAARAEIKLRIRQAEAAQKELSEVRRAADARQAELQEARRAAEAKQGELTRQINEKAAQAEKLTHDLAAEQTAAKQRLDEARAEALRLKTIGEARDNEFRKALAESMTRANEFEREAQAAREQLAEATAAAARRATETSKIRQEAQAAREQLAEATAAAARRAAETSKIKQEAQVAREQLAEVTAAARRAAEEETKARAEAEAALQALAVARERTAIAVVAPEPVQPPQQRPGQTSGQASPAARPSLPANTAAEDRAGNAPAEEPAPAKPSVAEVPQAVSAESAAAAINAPTAAAPTAAPLPVNPAAAPVAFTPMMSMSSVEEGRLLGRAEFLMRQADFAGARLLLEHAIEKGSARAMVLLGETYDEQTIHQFQPYGIKSDPDKARQLYELAAAFGVEAARERLATLSNTKR